MSRWGVVSTIKAPEQDVLNFAAWHLELGAHRLYLYLDEPDAALANRLGAHSRVKVVETGPDWWAKRKGRPEKHQSRQFVNARHAYNRRVEVDWLAHIDVDEFLWPARPIADQLAALPPDCLCARVRPIEALAGADDLYKAFHLDHRARGCATRILYPTFGAHLNGGFLSHVAGKLFYRTGVEGLRAKIHNIRVGETDNPGERPLPGTELCHRHAHDWEDWIARFRYRHARGSYREELSGGGGKLSMHALFTQIMAQDGEAGLRAFFDEVCTASPRLVAGLEAEGLLRHCPMDLDATRARHFPAA